MSDKQYPARTAAGGLIRSGSGGDRPVRGRGQLTKIAGPGRRTAPASFAGAGITPDRPTELTPGRPGTPHVEGGPTVYVIARRGSAELDSPVFHAGDTGAEEALAVFTTREAALRYIDRAGWADSDAVGGLPPPDLLRWLLQAAAQGVHWLVVDPDRDRHLAGDPQPVLGIAEELADFARSLAERVRLPA